MDWKAPAWLLIACLGCGGSSSPTNPNPTGPTHLHLAQRVLLGVQGGQVSGEGIDCGATCDATYVVGAGHAVTLTATGAAFGSFSVDCPGAACVQTTASSLVLDMSHDHVVEAVFRPRVNFVFVTSTTHKSNFGGFAGADALCSASAMAAGLGGAQYVAWLSAGNINAPERLGLARGWMRTDGAPVLDSVAALILENEFFYPIRLDENGHDVTDGSSSGFIPVWTGTTSFYGPAPAESCSAWTGSGDAAFVGAADVGAILWNSGSLYSCANWSLPIFCFETDYSTPFVPPPPPAGARLAFLSRSFTPIEGGSIADADAWCAADAAAAQLAGSFKALLADVGRSPASRFDASKGPWYRLDGVAIVDRAADLFAPGGPRLAAPLDLEADGLTRARPLAPAWTGFGGEVDDYTLPGTAATTCNGWSTRSSTWSGVTSVADFTWRSFQDVSGWPIPSCGGSAQLYCLQE
jgi:hypothetical protein